jgi:hypothetical protein
MADVAEGLDHTVFRTWKIWLMLLRSWTIGTVPGDLTHDAERLDKLYLKDIVHTSKGTAERLHLQNGTWRMCLKGWTKQYLPRG